MFAWYTKLRQQRSETVKEYRDLIDSMEGVIADLTLVDPTNRHSLVLGTLNGRMTVIYRRCTRFALKTEDTQLGWYVFFYGNELLRQVRHVNTLLDKMKALHYKRIVLKEKENAEVR